MKKFLLMLFFGTVSVFSVFSIGMPQSAYGCPSAFGGIISLLPFIIILIIFAAIGGKNLGIQVLVLKKFSLNENEDEITNTKNRFERFTNSSPRPCRGYLTNLPYDPSGVRDKRKYPACGKAG
jgi:hypothetical protein